MPYFKTRKKSIIFSDSTARKQGIDMETCKYANCVLRYKGSDYFTVHCKRCNLTETIDISHILGLKSKKRNFGEHAILITDNIVSFRCNAESPATLTVSSLIRDNIRKKLGV